MMQNPLELPNMGQINAGLADQSAQQLQQAQLMNEAQYKQMMSLYDPRTNLANQSSMNNARPDIPKLSFQTNANSVGEGIAQGVGNAFNNALALRNYGQQNQAFRDMSQAYQQNQQRQIDLAQRQAQAQQEREMGAVQQLDAIDPRLGQLYRVSSPEGRAAILSGIATKQTGVTYKPMEAVAETTGALQSLDKKDQYVQAKNTPLEVNGIPQPGAINLNQRVYGNVPVTSVDVRGDLAGVRKAENEVTAQPTQLQQDIDLKDLQIEAKRVENSFIEAEKRLALRKGEADFKASERDFKNLEKGQLLFNQLKDSGALYSNDPNVQAETQAQLGILGVKWNPPNAKYSTIKHKNGPVYQVDNTNNMIRELIEQNGKPSYGAWQELTD